jgi:hypothetical protein
MRDLMTIMEATGRKAKVKAPPAPSFNKEALLAEITKVQARLKPLGYTPDLTALNAAISMVSDEKTKLAKAEADNRERDGEYHDPSGYVLDAKEFFRDHVGRVINHYSKQHNIRRDVEHEEADYQHAMADGDDDPSNYVESSSFLSALHAQQDFAGKVLSFDAGAPATYAPILDSLGRIVGAFDAHQSGHERFEPMIVDSVREEISMILPVMHFVLTKIV